MLNWLHVFASRFVSHVALAVLSVGILPGCRGNEQGSGGGDAVHIETAIYVMAGDGWRVGSQNIASGILVLNVQTDRVDSVETIARAILARIDDPYDEVLFYFHRMSSPETSSFARVQWTPSGPLQVLHLE